MADAVETETPLTDPADGGVRNRPRAWLIGIQFSDGTQIELAEHEVVVLVGPNNVGKSQALRDIHAKLNDRGHEALVVRDLAYQLEGESADVHAWLNDVAAKQVRAGNQTAIDLPFGRTERWIFERDWGHAISGAGLRACQALFCIHLSTEARLGAANPIKSLNFADEPPTLPLHHLHENDDQEQRLSRLFAQAFGPDLIVNRGAGTQIGLHFGARPTPPGGDRMASSFRAAVHALPRIETQGDGIRAFVGVLLQTLLVDRDVVLIDEPEAFLHPPQAALLGRMLATELPAPRQLIVATHSTDFLRGVLDAPRSRVRVVRIRRSKKGNEVRELRPDDVSELWRDPLLRYSNVLDGLFHDGVIVCEADGDCRFYAALMDAVAGDQKRPDLLLVHGGGKSRMPLITQSLRALDVPTRAVVDFDVLGDGDTLCAIFESLGGDWEAVEGDWRIVQQAIQSKRPELSTDDVKTRIDAILDAVTDRVLPRRSSDAIREVVRRASAWSEAKKTGKAFVPNGQPTEAYNRLVQALRGAGLYIVEVGEVEQFCKSIGGHGPAWVMEALERDLSNDTELEDARAFARSLLAAW